MIFKKTTTIIIAITIVVGVNIYFNITLNNAIREINNSLDEFNIEKTENVWKKFKNKLRIFIEHGKLEEVEYEINLIKISIEQNNFNKVKECIQNIQDIFCDIKENNELSLINIF